MFILIKVQFPLGGGRPHRRRIQKRPSSRSDEVFRQLRASFSQKGTKIRKSLFVPSTEIISDLGVAEKFTAAIKHGKSTSGMDISACQRYFLSVVEPKEPGDAGLEGPDSVSTSRSSDGKVFYASELYEAGDPNDDRFLVMDHTGNLNTSKFLLVTALVPEDAMIPGLMPLTDSTYCGVEPKTLNVGLPPNNAVDFVTYGELVDHVARELGDKGSIDEELLSLVREELRPES